MIISMFIHVVTGNSLVVQWLALCAFTAVGLGLIPDWGTNIVQAMQYASLHPKRKIKNPCCKWHYFILFFFFLQLSNVPFYVCTTSSLSILKHIPLFRSLDFHCYHSNTNYHRLLHRFGLPWWLRW